MQTILLTGGSGYVGKSLVSLLRQKGFEVYCLTRHLNKEDPFALQWDPLQKTIDLSPLKKIDIVIQLAGANIFTTFWNKKGRELILNSRVLASQFLMQALHKQSLMPQLMLSASAAGYYGDCEQNIVTEEDSAGEGFLSHVAQEWERSAMQWTDFGTRVITLRLGRVLSSEALAMRMLKFACCCKMGTILGSGMQAVSWVSLADVLSITLFILQSAEKFTGAVNCASPQSLSQKEFMQSLCSALGQPLWWHVPQKLIEIFGGEKAKELLLHSCRAYPKKLLDASYTFADADFRLFLSKVWPAQQEIQGSL